MGIKWFSSRRRLVNQSNPQQAAPTRPAMLEPLEGRQMLASAAAVVTSTLADNRGYVEIRVNKALQSKTVSTKSVRVFDVNGTQLTATVAYNASKKTIIIRGNVTLDAAYRVKLYSSIIRDSDGLAIDGEFKTGGKSGNGTAGGDYVFRVKRDTSATPIAHFLGNIGNIDLRLFRGASTFSAIATPNAVANFLKYANAGDWDNLVVTRLANNFVSQMGHVKLTSTGALTDVPDKTPVGSLLGEPGNTNARGTVAWALSGDADTATNQFFFNWGNNNTDSAPNNLDDNILGGPFTAFGQITSSKGLAVIDAINALHRLDLTPATPTHPELNNVPIRPTVTVTGENPIAGGTTNTPLNTFKDFVVFSRVSILSKVVAA